jgi:tripartite-type tricarboxylate transporter receptor subunit TctC
MLRLVGGVLALLLAACAWAQSGPVRPVTVVVGTATGEGADAASRIIAGKLGESLGRPVVVENRPGARGEGAAEYVARSAPDGYTLLFAEVVALVVGPRFVTKPPVDPRRDLAPIALAAAYSGVLVVHPSVPARNLAEFVALAAQRPGLVTYGSSGVGSAGNLAAESLRLVAKADIVHVPYRSSGSALAALLGGQLAAVFAPPASCFRYVKEGKLRALAVTGAKRSPLLPDVPTIAESGYPGFEAADGYAYFAPAATPREIVERLNREIVDVIDSGDVREQLGALGLKPMPGTSDDLAKYMEKEAETWGRVAVQAGIAAN